jgi:outer membrane protein, adhesin transport system
LLDAENELFEARRAYTSAEMDIGVAYARTYTAQGELLNKLGVTRTDLPDVARSDYLDSEAVCKTETIMPITVDKPQLLLDAKPLSVVAAPKPEDATPAVENTVSQKALADNQLITKLTSDWAAAWERKDVDAYLAFYADTFAPEKSLTREAWVAQRRNRITNAGKISLVLQDIKVDVSGTKATSEFLQQYQTQKYQDNTAKTLNWEFIKDRWVIVRETSK